MTRDARGRLVRGCQTGPVTLILGAGISHSRGVPLWDDVVQRLVETVADDAGERDTLTRVRELVAAQIGPDVAARLRMRAHPLEPQLTLEWIRYVLERPEMRARVEEMVGADAASDPERTFASLLRWALYTDVRDHAPDRPDALSAVTEVIRSEAGRGAIRRLVRVVTLNADDLLEREVTRRGGADAIAPIVRASQYPPHGEPAPIPIYHLHGYLPRDPDDPMAAPDRLVFTDAQFWSTTANPMSFANRIIAHALHDSHCVFAGLSMRDVNLMRWLAVRYGELVADLGGCHDSAGARDSLERHFWIHAVADDPSGVVTDILAVRGVRSVSIDEWESDSFSRLLRECFAAPEQTRA